MPLTKTSLVFYENLLQSELRLTVNPLPTGEIREVYQSTATSD